MMEVSLLGGPKGEEAITDKDLTGTLIIFATSPFFFLLLVVDCVLLKDVTCTPVRGSIEIEIVGTDEAQVENSVKLFAQSWMEETDGTSFVGTREHNPEQGKAKFIPSFPSMKRLWQKATGNDGTATPLGISFAFFLCLALMILVALAVRKIKKRKQKTRMPSRIDEEQNSQEYDLEGIENDKDTMVSNREELYTKNAAFAQNPRKEEHLQRDQAPPLHITSIESTDGNQSTTEVEIYLNPITSAVNTSFSTSASAAEKGGKFSSHRKDRKAQDLDGKPLSHINEGGGMSQ